MLGIITVVFILAIVSQVVLGSVSLFTLLLYIFAVTACWIFLKNGKFNQVFKKSAQVKKEIKRDAVLIFLLIVLQLIVLQYFGQFPTHFHRDEFIEAYTSFSLPPVKDLNWFAGYPKTGWIVQNPILFFILQKPFLKLLGPSLGSIRLSVWAYHILIAAFLFLLAKELFVRRFLAFATVSILIFFAPNIYLASLGVHFASSTLFFLASFYFFIRLIKTHEKKYSLLCGLFVALSFLVYQASYLILPLLILFVTIELILQKSLKPLKLMIPAFILFLVIMMPFIAYAATEKNYFMQRIDQTNIMKRVSDKPAPEAINMIKNHFLINLKSLFIKRIGGESGYTFGKHALFNPIALILVILGFAVSVYKGIFLKRTIFLYLAITVIAALVLGMFLNMPPGAFHRVSVIFPFIALVIATPLHSILQKSSRKTKFPIPHALVILIVLLFAVTNFTDALDMVNKPGDDIIKADSVYIASYIQENFAEGTRLRIYAFPQYHLERELFFRTQNKYEFDTKRLNIELVPPDDKSPIILLRPSPKNIQTLKEIYPDASVINTINGMKLANNVMIVPEK